MKSISNFLKPKSPYQIMKEYCIKYQLNEDDLKSFIINYNKDKRIRVLIFSIFLWVFALTMIISGGQALQDNYFWLPIQTGKSMFQFINMFWIIYWFGFAVYLVIYGIIKLVRIYEIDI